MALFLFFCYYINNTIFNMNGQFLKRMLKASFFVAILACFVFVIFFGLNINKYASLQMGEKVIASTGGFPYEIGLTNVTVSYCKPSCCSAAGCTCCYGGSLCSADTPPKCPRATVSGVPAGGDGSSALILKTSLTQAGVSSGGQMIAGGISSTLMDGGVVAGNSGCSGCSAGIDDKDLWERSKLAFKYIISKLTSTDIL
jgi:hypothetical protein